MSGSSQSDNPLPAAHSNFRPHTKVMWLPGLGPCAIDHDNEYASGSNLIAHLRRSELSITRVSGLGRSQHSHHFSENRRIRGDDCRIQRMLFIELCIIDSQFSSEEVLSIPPASARKDQPPDVFVVSSQLRYPIRVFLSHNHERSLRCPRSFLITPTATTAFSQHLSHSSHPTQNHTLNFPHSHQSNPAKSLPSSPCSHPLLYRSFPPRCQRTSPPPLVPWARQHFSAPLG